MGSDDNAEQVLGHNQHRFESPTGFDAILKREHSIDIAAA
jgi:hypothetical protein